MIKFAGLYRSIASIYVYEQKKMRAHNNTIDVDKVRTHLMELYVLNQGSQNVLAYIPFG
jgi:hypothetical protein